MAQEAFSYRADPAVPAFPDDRPIIVFDGYCVLCSRFAQFVLRRDKAGLFRLMAAQSPTGEALYAHYGLKRLDYDSNLLIEDGRVWTKSEAAIRILGRLGLPWSLAPAARMAPLALRDRVYDVIARNRLRWFGARQTCYLPDPALADRFIT